MVFRNWCVTVVTILSVFSWTMSDVSATQKKEKVMAFFQMTCSTAQPNPCDQVCVDMHRGGFFCRCREGFTINRDGMSCSRIPAHDDNAVGSNNLDIISKNHDRAYKVVTPSHHVRNPALNEDGEVVIHDNDVVHIKSIDLTKGLPPLESDSHRRRLKTDSAFIPDHHYYNIPEARGSNDVYMDSFSNRLDIPEGGDTKQQKHVPKDVKKSKSENEVVDRSDGYDYGDYYSSYDYDEEDDSSEVEASCDKVVCENNGTCAVEREGAKCQCPLGTGGKHCEKLIEVKYPQFYGNGYLALPVLRNGHKEFTVSIEFRPESQNGLLLFSGEHASAKTDFISVVLEEGFVVFRFDCGTGPAVLKTPNRVTLAKWNRVVIKRVDNQGSVQLNGDHEVESSSQGEYSRITFRLNLYVGGYLDMESLYDKVGTLDSFVGCVQELVISGHVYDFRQKGLVGESEFGRNVGECSAGVCNNIVCENRGQCTAKSADSHVCLCPVGFHGARCERDTMVHIPHFSGHSYLEFSGLNRSVLSFTEIEVVFKPTSLHGAIFYNGFSRDRKGDFISLALQDGHIEYRFDLGTGPAVIRSYEPLMLNRWHVVKASRTGLMGTLIIDGQTQTSGQSTGAFTQLTLMDKLYLGGHPNFDHTSKHANLTRSFTGCLQKVVVNNQRINLMGSHLDGRNIEPCMHPCAGKPCMNGGECQPRKDDYVCYCPLGFENTNCEDEQSVLPTKPMFNGQSYLLYISDQIVKRVTGPKMDLQFNIRPKGRDGMIFWSGEDLMSKTGRDFIALGFYSGALHLRYDLGSGEALIGYNDSRLFDGNWHSIRVQRDKQDAYIEIDKREIVEGGSPGEYTSLNTDKTVFLGGMPDIAMKTGGRFTKGFEGCIQSLKLATDYDVKLLDHSQKGRNIVQCRKKYFKG